MLKNDEITNAIESAFRPLRCVAVIWDYEEKIRLKVFDANNKSILWMPRIKIESIRDEQQLRILFYRVREIIIQQGYSLEPWP